MAGDILYFLHRHFRIVAPIGVLIALGGIATAGWMHRA